MSSVNSQRIALQKDQECAHANSRMATVAIALQGKYGLVRTNDSLALIQILTADCLLVPGAKRLTAFDIHLSAVVYGATARPGQFAISHTYRNFIAYDLVALFSSPSTFSAGSTPLITPPEHWLSALKTLERRAAEPGRGGYEALLSIFADDSAINALVRSSVPTMNPMGTGAQRGCTQRQSSITLLHMPNMGRRLSSH